MPRAILVYNPTAGRLSPMFAIEKAANALIDLGWQINVERSTSGEHLTSLASQASSSGMDALFVAGGDGSINLALRGLIGSKTALGVLPTGTANVLAQELGLSVFSLMNWNSLEENARRLASAPVRAVDVGVCAGQPFLLWAGIGLDAQVIHQLEPRQRWEKYFALVEYASSALLNTIVWHGQDLCLFADGERYQGHYILVLVSNIQYYAGRLAHLSPGAQMNDGQMELWLFEGQAVDDIFQHAWNILTGQHITSQGAHCIPFHTLRIQASSPLRVHVDAEPVEDTGIELEINVHPQALNLLVPEPTPQSIFNQSGATPTHFGG